jgi:tetratricopeptide (TPR) repeat protein
MMETFLTELETEALNFRNQGYLEKAAEIFAQIINRQPNYEHGMCFYDLANCLEHLGDFKKAEENYLAAIKYVPDDLIRLGGYASFLYLHGDPKKAFDAHLHLLFLESELDQTENVKNITLALKALGKRLGFSENEVERKIDEQVSKLMKN